MVDTSQLCPIQDSKSENKCIGIRNEMIYYIETLKNIFEERIRIRKLLIKNLDICINLTDKYPLLPWLQKYILHQKEKEIIYLRKEIKVLNGDAKLDIINDLEISYTNKKKKRGMKKSPKKNDINSKLNIVVPNFIKSCCNFFSKKSISNKQIQCVDF